MINLNRLMLNRKFLIRLQVKDDIIFRKKMTMKIIKQVNKLALEGIMLFLFCSSYGQSFDKATSPNAGVKLV